MPADGGGTRCVGSNRMFASLGHAYSLRELPLGIAASRAAWAIDWMIRTIEARKANVAELRDALGRLFFCFWRAVL